jgi:hypothetical protein
MLKFQLGVSENKHVILSPVQVHGPLEIYPRTPKGTVDPRLRTPDLELCLHSPFVFRVWYLIKRNNTFAFDILSYFGLRHHAVGQKVSEQPVASVIWVEYRGSMLLQDVSTHLEDYTVP